MPHTPGPWTITPPSGIGLHDVLFGSVTANDGAALIIPHAGRGEIATANAHLIAAAPDLLAAGIAVLDAGDWNADVAARKTLRLAIAKAKGL